MAANEITPRKKSHDEIVDEVVAEQHQFGGYTIKELKYRRAVLELQKEFCMEKINADLGVIRQRLNPMAAPKGKQGKLSRLLGGGSLASKLLHGLNYMDYAVMGFTLFNYGRKAVKFFKKK